MWLNIINQKLTISFILYILKVNIETYYIINSDANYNSKMFLKNLLYYKSHLLRIIQYPKNKK
jgi:hypothetical protein